MTTGIVFDILEFAIHDGPGLRTTVFLKGCPLRCSWCHNPEGISAVPQVMHSASGDRVVGTRYTPSELARLLNEQADIFRANEGGVTFSGGEPLQQARFVAETIELLQDLHVAIETSGQGREAALLRLARLSDLVFYDLKLIDAVQHMQFTGRDNSRIRANLRLLANVGVPFIVRVPLIPGVTDTEDNLTGIAREVRGLPNLVGVELLPYNRAAGGKYRSVDMEWKPGFDEAREPSIRTAPFERMGVGVRVT